MFLLRQKRPVFLAYFKYISLSSSLVLSIGTSLFPVFEFLQRKAASRWQCRPGVSGQRVGGCDDSKPEIG